MTVKTADVRGAGTNAKVIHSCCIRVMHVIKSYSLSRLSQVFCELFGEDGSSGERILENAQDNFERAKTDVFKFDCVDLGPINVCLFFKKIKIIIIFNFLFCCFIALTYWT